MKSTTALYRKIIASGESRNWKVTISMHLADNTSLVITEQDIMVNSFKISTASSSESTFDIGSAIIGKCQFTLNNYDDKFTQYDFFNATARVSICLVGDSNYINGGVYTVDDPVYAGSLVQIEMLDNMWKFDRPLPNIGVPCSLETAVSILCTHCGVVLSNYNFHGHNFVLNEIPEKDMNCRELLQYIAMIGCNFCVIDELGYLRIKWYNTDALPFENDLDGGTFNTTTTPYSDGDTADGGNFTNYNSGDNYDGGAFYDPTVVYFSRLMSRNVGTDEIQITGVKFTIEDTDYRIGQDGYVLSLDNPLVTINNVSSVLNLIWDVLEGFKMRTFDVTALPDIIPEVGDCVGISYKGTILYSFLTNFTFTPSLVSASLGAESPTKTLSTRFSKSVQTAIEIAREEAKKQISTYDIAVQHMNELAINAMGAYQDYEDLSTGGRVYYLSNMPITKVDNVCSFESGSTVFKTSGSGLFVSTDGGTTWTNGYNPQTGQLIVNVLYAIGIHADWIVTGLLRDQQNSNYWNLDTGEFRLAANTTFGGHTISDVVSDEISDILNQQEIFDLLTNGGQVQGITLYNGQLYINATYIASGILTSTNYVDDGEYSSSGTFIDMSTGEIKTKVLHARATSTSTDHDLLARGFRVRPKDRNDDADDHFIWIENYGQSKYVRISNEELRFNDNSYNPSRNGTYKKDGWHLYQDDYNYMFCSVSDLYRTINGVSQGVPWGTSDERVKDNIEPLDAILSIDFIDGTEPKSFNYKNIEGKHYGMIAQDVRALLDNLGEENAHLEHSMGIPEDISKIEDQRTIDYQEYIPHLINYVKDLRNELNRVKTELNHVKSELISLKET